MVAASTYTAIDDAGLHYVADGLSRVLPVDHVVVCAGQESDRDLYDSLVARGARPRLIGGADAAAELDAARAIDRRRGSPARSRPASAAIAARRPHAAAREPAA